MLKSLAYLIVLAIGASPILEVRGGVVFGIGAGLNPYLTLILAIIGNIICTPLAFAILRQARLREWVFKHFRKSADKHIGQHSSKFDFYKEIALLVFVAIPLPITGAYLAVLISELLGWNWKKSLIAISMGIVIAGITTLLGAEGVIHLISLF